MLTAKTSGDPEEGEGRMGPGVTNATRPGLCERFAKESDLIVTPDNRCQPCHTRLDKDPQRGSRTRAPDGHREGGAGRSHIGSRELVPRGARVQFVDISNPRRTGKVGVLAEGNE